MKNLTIIPIHSVSDIITNSSSELFIIDNENTTLQLVSELTRDIHGILEPFIFHVEEFKRGDRKYDRLHGWLTAKPDPNFWLLTSEFDKCFYYENFYNFPFWEEFQKLRKEHNAMNMKSWDIEETSWYKDFVKRHIDEVFEHSRYNANKLEGSIVFLSEEDNSVGWDDWKKLEALFPNMKHIHLG